jgi:hypothetical protein
MQIEDKKKGSKITWKVEICIDDIKVTERGDKIWAGRILEKLEKDSYNS